MTETIQYFLLWLIIWLAVLHYPPGSKEIVSQYRLNGIHGFISTVFAFGYTKGIFSDTLTVSISEAYFVVDLINMFSNDMKGVKSFHSPSNRKVEYIHHFLCLIVLIVLQWKHKEICLFAENPGPYLMLAEASTVCYLSSSIIV
jgi:hypothetical protein